MTIILSVLAGSFIGMAIGALMASNKMAAIDEAHNKILDECVTIHEAREVLAKLKKELHE